MERNKIGVMWMDTACWIILWMVIFGLIFGADEQDY
jgi:hypothetical protein